MSSDYSEPERHSDPGGRDEVLLNLSNVAKSYRIWRRPSERFLYGLLNSLPRLTPGRLRSAAANLKGNLGQEVFALDKIDLAIKRGRSVGIIGRNGSGKSTLLQLIAGILQPTAGRVSVQAKRVTALLELGSSFDPSFTGRENVLLHGAMLGLSEQENNARLPEVMDFAEIEEYFDRPVRTYSSGMALRVAFASAISVRPDLFIVDEALAVGDVFFQQKCFQRIRKLSEQGVTILLASHDLRSISEFCQEALVLDHGRVIFFGDPNEATTRYYGLTRSFQLSGKQASSDLLKEGGVSDVTLSPITSMIPKEGAVARFIGFAVFDEHGKAAELFRQGEWLKLICQIEALDEIENLSFGLVLRDDRAVFLHTKHLFQADASQLRDVKPGERFRGSFALRLDVGPGRYTLALDMLSIPHTAFKEGKLAFPDFDELHRRVGSTGELFAFTVSFNPERAGAEFSHFGLFDLPSIVSLRELEASTAVIEKDCAMPEWAARSSA